MTHRLIPTNIPNLEKDLVRAVTIALEEDIGSGDITAELIPADQSATATIITREDCVVCGIAWADEVFKQLDESIVIEWKVSDGESVSAGTEFCTLSGNTRALLTGERTALNFLQLLSGTATTSSEYAKLVKGTDTKILDTRKTIPGLRTAQKYAVKCGGCDNHRIGLYDAFLIKENHIAACDGIKQAIKKAKDLYPDKIIEVEVETIEELVLAVKSKADIAMLDNFDETSTIKAASTYKNKIKLEVSGNIDHQKIASQPQLNVDLISSGALTKNIKSIDLSMTI